MNPSEAVVQAVRFLRGVYQDVAALIGALDQEAGHHGWVGTLKNKISTDLTNGLSPEGWIIKYVSRIYVPRESLPAQNPRVVLGFVVCFEPERHDHAVAVAVGAKLDGTLSADALWNAWKDTRPLLVYLREHPEEGPLPTKVLQEGFIANAVEGKAFVSPLMELESMDVVRSRLWKPAFDALSRP